VNSTGAGLRNSGSVLKTVSMNCYQLRFSARRFDLLWP
jgi:hypothetical protein